MLARPVERYPFLDFAGRVENADLAFPKTAALPRIKQRVLFRVGAGEVWLHSGRFERLPAAAVRPDFDDALGLNVLNIRSQ